MSGWDQLLLISSTGRESPLSSKFGETGNTFGFKRGRYLYKKNSITGGPQKIKSNPTRRLKVHHSSINGGITPCQHSLIIIFFKKKKKSLKNQR
jgi:hypothetical protein